jgi:hypothetical protein
MRADVPPLHPAMSLYTAWCLIKIYVIMARYLVKHRVNFTLYCVKESPS